MMFERKDALLDDLRSFAADPTLATIPCTFAAHEVGAALLQLAAGRTPESLEIFKPGSADFETAQRCLAYVVFDPKNTYFTLLCVDRNAPDEAIKDNYRRLIALVHPDANPIGFPADAASRVNLGYAVLSNLQARASYAESLDRLPTVAIPKAKDHPSEPGGTHSGSRLQRPAASRTLFAWIKRPRFGFGLLVLATILIAPVVIILTNMAKDAGGERLVSLRDRSEQKLAAVSAEPTVSKSTVSSKSTDVPSVTAVTENGSTFGRSTPPQRADNPVQTNNAVVAARDAIKAPNAVLEQAAMALFNAAPPPAGSATSVANPGTVKLSLAPVPARLLDNTARADAITDGRSTRLAAPQTTAPTSGEVAANATSGAAATAQSTVKTQPVATAQNPPTVAIRVTETRSRDSEDTLLRFGSAFEQGSIDNLRTLFASAMPGRTQMIADYQRVFSNTRQRNIRFLQLKHTVVGQRVTTVGQAVVNTTGADNKTSSQRVFLEIEVARDGNDVRIERMSNYAFD